MAGFDYQLGRLDPKEGLGRIFVYLGDREYSLDEGEVLVETEPVRYELRQIKVDKWRSQVKKNLTELGSTVLQNSESMSNLVEAVITYEYDRMVYWGTHDGVARGLPTAVYDEVGARPMDIYWAQKVSEKRLETKTVSTNLQPGTAINVTVTGNYTKTEGPYKALLVSYYADNDNALTREITTIVSKSGCGGARWLIQSFRFTMDLISIIIVRPSVALLTFIQ